MSDVSEKSKSNEEIARRAYEIYLDRGCENGRDVDDWLAAEKELKGEDFSSSRKTKTAAAGQGGSALFSEKDSKQNPLAHHDRLNASR
jgi:Protein of unknown function (DUF2934)